MDVNVKGILGRDLNYNSIINKGNEQRKLEKATIIAWLFFFTHTCCFIERFYSLKSG